MDKNPAPDFKNNINNNTDEKVYALVDSGCFNEARQLVYQYIKNYQNNERFVILFILFKISDLEKASGEQDIFSSPACGTVNFLLKHYTKIKFYLRRYEYNMPEASLEEALDYFITNKVSVNALQQIAGFACVDKNIVFGRLGQAYRKKGMFDKAIAFEDIVYGKN